MSRSTEQYKVGDCVLLCSIRPLRWNSNGKMDRYLNRIVKINYIDDYKFRIEQDKDDDGIIWSFNVSDIVRKGYLNKEKLSNIINTYKIF